MLGHTSVSSGERQAAECSRVAAVPLPATEWRMLLAVCLLSIPSARTPPAWMVACVTVKIANDAAIQS